MSTAPLTADTIDKVALSDPEIPEGWARATLGSLLEVKYGKGLKESARKTGPVHVFGSNGVVGNHELALTAGTTIIIGRKGTVGAVAFSSPPCWPIDTTYYIDDFAGMDPRFLLHALRHLDLARLDTSTAVPGLNRDDLYAQEILVAPLAEQRRIAATADALSIDVGVVRDRLARVLVIVKSFRQSVLAAACSGLLTEDWRSRHPEAEPAAEFLRRYGRKAARPSVGDIDSQVGAGELPSTWASCNLESLFLVQTGTTPSRTRADFYEGGTIPWVKTGEVQNGDILATEERVTELALEETSLKILPIGTILIAMYGEGRTRGQVGRLRISATTNQACAALVNAGLPPETTDYLFLYCQSLYAEFRDAAVGGNQPNLNLRKVRVRRVNLPPLDEQREICRRVQEFFRLADAIKERVALAGTRVERITQAILAKAFRGELVLTEAELARRENRAFESGAEPVEQIRESSEYAAGN